MLGFAALTANLHRLLQKLAVRCDADITCLLFSRPHELYLKQRVALVLFWRRLDIADGAAVAQEAAGSEAAGSGLARSHPEYDLIALQAVGEPVRVSRTAGLSRRLHSPAPVDT